VNQHATAFPLQWPEGWERTSSDRRTHARYKVNQERAQQDLVHSLKLLGAQHIVISTNVELRRDGLPYANRPRPQDPGVAAYWYRKGRNEVIACDTWLTVSDNMRAVYMAVEALRQLERCGASEILGRAFQGFGALPPASGTVKKRTWREVFDWRNPDRPSGMAIRMWYRQFARERHPDNGGSHEAMVELNAAFEEALREAGAA
jgi:hypothetical protein